jgi:hypothetical protein
MAVVRRKSLLLALGFTAAVLAASWTVSPEAFGRSNAISEGDNQSCPPDTQKGKQIQHRDFGVFDSTSSPGPSELTAIVGHSYLNREGLKTTALQITRIGGKATADAVGATEFWFDGSRPLVSELWERRQGTGFPAIQEMRFHFFYTIEAAPGVVYRSVNPAVMRSDDVTAFPPPKGTKYFLVEPVAFEDASKPGEIVGHILSNEVTI